MGTHPERTGAKDDTMKIENINFTDSIKTALSGDMRGLNLYIIRPTATIGQ